MITPHDQNLFVVNYLKVCGIVCQTYFNRTKQKSDWKSPPPGPYFDPYLPNFYHFISYWYNLEPYVAGSFVPFTSFVMIYHWNITDILLTCTETNVDGKAGQLISKCLSENIVLVSTVSWNPTKAFWSYWKHPCKQFRQPPNKNVSQKN